MGKNQYYPPSAPELSENHIFGMFHASTPQHSKDVIMGSLQVCHGTVRVVFASVAVGMGIDLHEVNRSQSIRTQDFSVAINSLGTDADEVITEALP